MTKNRPVKEVDFFNELKEDVNFQKDVKTLREYLKLEMFVGDKNVHDATLDWFLRKKGVLKKYKTKTVWTLKSNLQDFRGAVTFLLEKHKMQPQHYDWIRNFVLNENYIHNKALDKPVITYTKEKDEILEEYNLKINKMSTEDKEEYYNFGGASEEANKGDEYHEYINHLDELYPISIKFSPFISPGKVAKFITENKKEIEAVQEKYKTNFNKRIGKARQKTEQVSREEALIMKLHAEGKSIEEIHKTVAGFHIEDEKTWGRIFKPSDIRKVIKKRQNFGI